MPLPGVAKEAGALSYLNEIGPWVVSFLALAQVWIIAAYKKWVRRGNIHIHESGVLEVGYNSFGPTIALTGTLRCIDYDVFVNKISLSVKRKKDSAQYSFDWYGFGNRTVSFGKGAEENKELEVASAFLVSPTKTFDFNILFVDMGFVSEHRPLVAPFIQKWNDHYQKRISEISLVQVRSADDLYRDITLKTNIYDEFFNTRDATEAFTILDRSFYWTQGEYELTFNVECSDPVKIFKKTWNFVLGEEDVKRLRLNAVIIMKALCGLPFMFNFSYPEYKNIN